MTFNGYSNGGHDSISPFSSIDSRTVTHDLFLDGNSFTDSHRVNKKHLDGDPSIGLAIQIGRPSSTCCDIFHTRQFTSQNHYPEYGAITLAFSF